MVDVVTEIERRDKILVSNINGLDGNLGIKREDREKWRLQLQDQKQNSKERVLSVTPRTLQGPNLGQNQKK